MAQSRLYLSADRPETQRVADILDPVLEDLGITSVLFEDDEAKGNWCYSLYVPTDEVESITGVMRDHLGNDLFGLELHEEVLEDIDWVTQSLADLKPIRAGRFFVHGSHDRDAAKNERMSVEINAGQAFGTGHHGTTAGCLDLLEMVLKQSNPQAAYDIGTGSGVLAIALAKARRIPILATDIDPISTQVARENARLNQVASYIRFETATGFDHTSFDAFGRVDLLMANILARPLQALAQPMRRHLLSGGDVVLSGLLPHQKAQILATYRMQGLFLHKAYIRDGWLSLWLKVA